MVNILGGVQTAETLKLEVIITALVRSMGGSAVLTQSDIEAVRDIKTRAFYTDAAGVLILEVNE